MSLWSIGGGMVIYLAGLKSIPQSLYEAARLDGASAWRRFLTITLPMLSPLLFYQFVMGIIGSFQIFTQAKFITPLGGPGESNLYYVFNFYRQAFEFHNIGYASAMAWILFLLILVLTVLIFTAGASGRCGSRGGIERSTSMPCVTCPKMLCFPSSQGVGTWVIKNWEPLVLAPALAIESTPGLS